MADLTHRSRQAYERIRTAIAEGQLPPAEVIREVDLVRDFGMSRTPVREALHRLHGEGLIKPVAPGGYVAIELGPKELRDIYEVREMLVGLAARLAAQRRTRVDLARLEDVLEALGRACDADATEEADELVRTFFHTIADAGGNDYLRATLGRLTNLFRYKALAVTHKAWRSDLSAWHRELVDAIADGDAERAEARGRALIAHGLTIRLVDLQMGELTA